MQVFYKAGRARCSDIIPFFDKGHFKPFYLKRWPPGYTGTDAKPGWYMLDTEDFVHFKEHDTGISGATGSVIEVDGVYHMFFCRLTPESQTIRHAVSTDLDRWEEIPEDTFRPDGKIYAMSDWRDPFVFFNEEEQQWWMLACASLADAPTGNRGCVSLCVSSDLHHWEFRQPFYAPGLHQSALECPDLFKMGDWYYLLFSTASNRFQTFYRMSKSMNGPWIAPEIDTFDTRAMYAAKTASDGENRYLFAWVAAKDFNTRGFNPPFVYGKDYGTWDHGGTMIVHRLVQKEDGTLGVAAPQSVKDAFCYPQPVVFRPLQGEWKQDERGYRVESPYAYACALMNTLPQTCRIHMDCSFGGHPLNFGIALQADEEFVRAYYICMEPGRQRVHWKSPMRMDEDGGCTFPYEVELERPLTLQQGKVYPVDILMERDMVVVYIDGTVAMTARAFDYSARRLGVFVANGSARFENVQLMTVEE